jgi:hypothetical protein
MNAKGTTLVRSLGLTPRKYDKVQQIATAPIITTFLSIPEKNSKTLLVQYKKPHTVQMFKDIPATFQIYCAKGQEKKRKSYVS